ncbi:MAG: DUF3575 domain-containing protein [Bacteroidales bacterium]|nr:DUF3575 domain-containing protein [Bacteroidales bacterium]
MKKLMFFSLLLFVVQGLSAQEGYQIQQKNLIKVNLIPIAFRNYSIQYERTLSKTVSVAVAYRFMPEGTIPLKNKIINYAEPDDQQVIDILNEAQLSNFAITPEVRFYLGKKGFGRGFYVSLFYRYSNFDANNIFADFEEEDVNVNVEMTGNIKSHTVGFVLGSQWALSKHLCLDLWFLGPHYGTGSGSFTGIPSSPMSTEQQNIVRDKLNEMDIDPYTKTVEVNENRAAINIKGPFGGFRAGLSLGIKF